MRDTGFVSGLSPTMNIAASNTKHSTKNDDKGYMVSKEGKISACIFRNRRTSIDSMVGYLFSLDINPRNTIAARSNSKT